jgi:phage-related minor tail protein
LRLEAEIAKLKGQGFTPEEIGTITAKKTELAAPKTDQQNIADKIGKLKDEIAELTSLSNIAITSAEGIGNAFAQSFQGLISGSMTAKEALGSFFKSVADMFLEMAAKIIAKQITMIILQTILKALGAVAGGSGGGGGGGGTVTGDFMNTEALKGFTPAANGATFANGIAKFANGGIVGSPTLFKFADGGTTRTGLMGEAGPEAIMPLKRGADGSLGVQANGLRDAMNQDRAGGSGSPVLNMSFQSTNINGVEYVSRDQLESAMAQTRRDASRDGAKRGMTMTLDKLQQSPSTRSRVGMR